MFQKFTKACEQFPFIEDNPEFGFIAYLNAKYNLKIASPNNTINYTYLI